VPRKKRPAITLPDAWVRGIGAAWVVPVEAQAGEYFDARVELAESDGEGAFTFFVRLGCGRRTGIAPMRCLGCPGHTGQTCCAARSHTVNTK
jgi:hypothetical protein